MFTLKDNQRRPAHSFRIENHNTNFSISSMIDEFNKIIKLAEMVPEKSFKTISDVFQNPVANAKKMKVHFSQQSSSNFPKFSVTWNSAKNLFDSNEIFMYNISKNTRKFKGQGDSKKTNEKYGVVIYVYILNRNDILKSLQYNEHFKLEFKKDFKIDTATVNKPSNLFFKMTHKNGDFFYVASKEEADFVSKEGYIVEPVKVVEVNGRIFEIVKEIKSDEVKYFDAYADKIKGYTTQKSAKEDSRPFFEVKTIGRSTRDYFTFDFNTAESGFYKVYGDIEGYVLVESITTLLKGKESVITFIKNSEKDKISKILKVFTLTK